LGSIGAAENTRSVVFFAKSFLRVHDLARNIASMKTTAIPLHLRQLKAQMALKGLTLKEVVEAADVNYSIASAILNGIRVQEDILVKLAGVINKAPMPVVKEVGA
jgi:hypothetical protein